VAIASGHTPSRHPSKVVVYLIEQNALAAGYLFGILQKDTTLRLVSQEKKLPAEGAAHTPVSAVLVDAGTLRAPLEKYAQWLRSRFPNVPGLVLDEELPEERLARLLFLGIRGFILYRDVERQLSRAIHAVCGGRLWVPAQALEQSLASSDRATPDWRRDARCLSRREKSVIELVQQRLSNKEVSSRLGISESTVKFHLGHIYAKLGLRNRHEIP
jgi:DNA-binding NarL/FixJ family response regulator